MPYFKFLSNKHLLNYILIIQAWFPMTANAGKNYTHSGQNLYHQSQWRTDTV